MYLRWACFSLSLLVAWPSAVRAAEPASTDEPVWEIESLEPGEFDYHLDKGLVILNDRFRITFEEQGERAYIIADRGRLDQTTGEIFAEGGVILQNQDRVVTSDRLFYNFQTRAMQTDNFRAGQAPFFVEGTNIKGDATSNRYSADDVWLTTDDRSDPVLRLRTRHLSIVPGKYVEARGATLYAGKVPVFYFPYYRHRLDRPPNQWGLTPGYRSRFGLFFEGSYDWHLSDRLGCFAIRPSVTRPGPPSTRATTLAKPAAARRRFTCSTTAIPPLARAATPAAPTSPTATTGTGSAFITRSTSGPTSRPSSCCRIRATRS